MRTVLSASGADSTRIALPWGSGTLGSVRGSALLFVIAVACAIKETPKRAGPLGTGPFLYPYHQTA